MTHRRRSDSLYCLQQPYIPTEATFKTQQMFPFHRKFIATEINSHEEMLTSEAVPLADSANISAKTINARFATDWALLQNLEATTLLSFL